MTMAINLQIMLFTSDRPLLNQSVCVAARVFALLENDFFGWYEICSASGHDFSSSGWLLAVLRCISTVSLAAAYECRFVNLKRINASN